MTGSDKLYAPTFFSVSIIRGQDAGTDPVPVSRLWDYNNHTYLCCLVTTSWDVSAPLFFYIPPSFTHFFNESKLQGFLFVPSIKLVPISIFNPLNAELNSIFHLLALLGVRYILHVSRIRVNMFQNLLPTPNPCLIFGNMLVFTINECNPPPTHTQLNPKIDNHLSPREFIQCISVYPHYLEATHSFCTLRTILYAGVMRKPLILDVYWLVILLNCSY